MLSPVRDVERDSPRGLNVRALLESCADDLTADDLARLLKGISAHSTRVGLNQDLFASRISRGSWTRFRWKRPRMPLAYNRNLAADQGAAGRLMAKIG